MNLEALIEMLNYLGINVNESTNPIVLFLCWVLLFNIFALLCVLNIIMYVFAIYLLEDKNRLDKIKKYLPSKINPYFDRIVNYYKTIRIISIWFEVVMLLFILISLIVLTLKVISLLLL